MSGAAKTLIVLAMAGTVACSQNPATPSAAGDAAAGAGLSNVSGALLQRPSPQAVNPSAQLVENGIYSVAGPGGGTEIVGGGSSPLGGTASGTVAGGDYVTNLSGGFSLTIRDLYSLPGVDTNYSCDAGQTNPPNGLTFVRDNFISQPLSGSITVSADQTVKLSGTPAGKVVLELSTIGNGTVNDLTGWTINLHSPSSGGALFSALTGGGVEIVPFFGGNPNTAPSGAVRFSKPATSRRADDGISLLCRGDFVLTLTP
jgi:hypothetical protein